MTLQRLQRLEIDFINNLHESLIDHPESVAKALSAFRKTMDRNFVRLSDSVCISERILEAASDKLLRGIFSEETERCFRRIGLKMLDDKHYAHRKTVENREQSHQYEILVLKGQS